MLCVRIGGMSEFTRTCADLFECTTGKLILFFGNSRTFKKTWKHFYSQCWKSRVRDAYGTETVSRGCTTHHDHLPFYCKNYGHSSAPKKRDTSGQYNIECCVGDFCNNGTFPELPPLPNDDHEATGINSTRSYIVMAFGMLGAIVAVVMVVCVVLYVRRRTDHKRMIPSRTKHDQDTYYAGDELLRVTSAGDSTLRVSFFVISNDVLI